MKGNVFFLLVVLLLGAIASHQNRECDCTSQSEVPVPVDSPVSVEQRLSDLEELTLYLRDELYRLKWNKEGVQ